MFVSHPGNNKSIEKSQTDARPEKGLKPGL
jgi:hypothetical protein